MQKRWQQLDILRGIAILLVLGNHVVSHDRAGLPWLAVKLLNFWRHCGWIGVDLFFVLSGFLVSGLLFREYVRYQEISISRFLIRRGLKIYPAYYIFLFAPLILFFSLRTGSWAPPDAKAFFSEALFIQNYGPSFWSHTWSLAVEEHFYLFLCLLLFFLSKRRTAEPFRVLPLLCAGLMTSVFFLRVATYHFVRPFDFHTHLAPTHLRIDALLCGVVLSYFYHFEAAALERAVRGAPRSAPWLCLALIAYPSVMLRENFYAYTFGLTFLYTGFGGLMLYFFYREFPATGWAAHLGAVLAVVGYYSYSIYLWHAFVARLLSLAPAAWSLNPFGYAALLAAYLGGSVGLGILMAALIETPCLRWRDAAFPSRSGAVERAPKIRT